MRAVTIDRYGGPEVLRIRSDVPVPSEAPGRVLVKVMFAGINFMDIHTRQGKYASSRTYQVRLPCTLGIEGAGEVVAAGPGVDHLRPGDRVAWCIAWGSYAEYASVPAALAARLPHHIGYDLAAAAMFQGCTGHYLVNDIAKLDRGSTCLVHAGSGSIGQLLIQMAKRKGAKVFATASTAEKCAVARARGADVVMTYENGAFPEAIRFHTAGLGVDVAFDAVGYTTLRGSMRATRQRGLVVNYGSVSGPVTDLDPIELGEAGSLFLTRPRLADYMTDAATVQRRADDIFAAIAAHELHVDLAETYKLEDVQTAHTRIEHREQVGKPIIRI